ncbi:MAG: carbohydrate kinase family protein [Cyclobacteriaceae bacterium]
MTEIACVGILCVDALAKPVDNLPEKGKLKLVDNITLQIGGCAANVSISLAKIGLPVSVIGRIGSDRLGQILLETLTAEKVDVKGLKVDATVSTSASLVMISNDSERSIVHAMGANRFFCFDDIDLHIIQNSRILLIAGTFLMPHFDGEGTEKLLKFASAHNVLCCMDTAWDSTGEWLKKIESCLPYLDWFMPSYEEACNLSGKTDLHEMAQIFFSKGVKNIIIKLDSQGCFVNPQGENGFIVPSYNKIDVKDSSGAGDSFCAGFITGLYNQWTIRECAMFGNAVGAHCVMEIGTTTGIKTMKEVLEFMKEYNS